MINRILKRDYIHELNGDVYIKHKNTIDWMNNLSPTMGDPLVRRGFIEAYEQQFGTDDRDRWLAQQHVEPTNRPEDTNDQLHNVEAMYNQLMDAQVYSQQERLRADALNPTPTLEFMLMSELPEETMDIIGETGEEYELSLVQTLGFIIDMYRQFSKKGENQTLSDINNELSKLKEGDIDGHNANSKWDKSGTIYPGREEETEIPF